MEEEEKRVVVITGGSRGIGRAITLRFAAENPTVIIVHYDPDEKASDETLELLEKKQVEAVSRKLDVSSWEDVNTFFKDVIDQYGRVDVLVNNAGVTRDTLLMRMNERDWDSVIQVNLKSVFNCTHAVIRAMMKERYGRIVNISSVVGQIGNPGQANYSASKAGIMGFTKSVARELASRNVTVNAVAPGFIETEMTAQLPEKAKEAFLAQIPLGRAGQPEDVAQVVKFLISEEASYITGQVIHLNGGMYM